MTVMRQCLDCGRLAPNTRCSECESTRNKARGSSSERSYGAAHQRIRAYLLPLAYGTPCPRCGETMHAWQSLDLDHADPMRKKVGLPGDRIVHAHCNRAGREWR